MATTEDDHRRALDWADAARTARGRLLDELAAATCSLADALNRGRSDDLVGRIKLLPVLEALPGATKVGTRRALDELGVDHATPLAALSDEQAVAVVERFGAGADR